MAENNVEPGDERSTETSPDGTSSTGRKASIVSTGSQHWNLVLEGAQRDIQTEIGFAEDKISLLLCHRQIELDPNFWALDDDIVDLLKNGSPEDVQEEIERKEKWILELKTKLSKANKVTRFMYSNQAVFHAAIDAFTRLMPIPEGHESTNKIRRLAESICYQLLQLEETTAKNIELKMKLTALDDQIHALQVKMKEINKATELANVQPRLEAVELQNCMLNELMGRIISRVQETSVGMKTLECGEEYDVREAIREGLSFRSMALDDCFPNLTAIRNSLSKYLWVPHDTSIGGTLTVDQLMKQFSLVDRLDISMMQGLKHLKKSTKEMEQTHAKVLEIKKKVLIRDQRQTENRRKILRFSIPKRLEHHDTQSIDSHIAHNALVPVPSVSIDKKKENIDKNKLQEK